MSKYISFRISALFTLICCSFYSQDAHALGAAQTNFNFGLDMPASAAKHTAEYNVLRFQIEQVQTLFSPRFSFTLDMGSGLRGGEVNVGVAAYPVWKARDELPIQPFLGVDGGAYLGSRDGVVGLSPGFALFGGADIRLVKKLGLTLESDYLMYANQNSARIFVGLTYTNL